MFNGSAAPSSAWSSSCALGRGTGLHWDGPAGHGLPSIRVVQSMAPCAILFRTRPRAHGALGVHGVRGTVSNPFLGTLRGTRHEDPLGRAHRRWLPPVRAVPRRRVSRAAPGGRGRGASQDTQSRSQCIIVPLLIKAFVESWATTDVSLAIRAPGRASDVPALVDHRHVWADMHGLWYLCVA